MSAAESLRSPNNDNRLTGQPSADLLRFPLRPDMPDTDQVNPAPWPQPDIRPQPGDRPPAEMPPPSYRNRKRFEGLSTAENQRLFRALADRPTSIVGKLTVEECLKRRSQRTPGHPQSGGTEQS